MLWKKNYLSTKLTIQRGYLLAPFIKTNMGMMRIFSLFFIINLFISCEKEIAIENGHNAALVINAIIIPDSIVKVNVSRVAGIGEVDAVLIRDAVVKLFNDDEVISTLPYSSDGWYISYFNPAAESVYKVRVDYDNIVLEASTSIPKKTEIEAATIVIGNIFDKSNDPVSEISISFTDNPLSANFYELILTNGQKGDPIGYYNYYHMKEPVIINEGDWEFQPTTFFFSDELFNGQTTTLNFEAAVGYTTARSLDTELLEIVGRDNIFAQLRSVSKEYYLFRKYWTRHYFNQQNGNHLDDPLTLMFLGDPIEMYTNVQNGYGVFAGYSQSIKIIQNK